MSLEMTALRGGGRVKWSRLLGLLLVPLTVAGVLLWGLWNPQDRLDAVTAAVVNLDEPVQLDGRTVPLGRVLAGELIGGPDDETPNFTWVLTDADDAAAGLDDGHYATVVTIPRNFSAAATSPSRTPDQFERATIDIAESDAGRLIDTALSGIVTSTATRVLNQRLGEQFVGNVFVGMSELSRGIGEAAGGASQLADGGAQLSDGAAQLADGTSQLAVGTRQLASGAGELSNGSAQLAGGVTQYVGGASQLAEAYGPLGQGASAAVAQLKTTIGALGQLQIDSAAPSEQLSSGLTAVGAGASGLGNEIPGLVERCLTTGGDPAFCAEMGGTLGKRASEIGAGAEQAAGGAAGLQAASAALQRTLGAGQTGDGDPIAQLDQLSGGLAAFGSGLDSLAAQGTQLASGASQLASGASRLSVGTGDLAASTPELAEGASQLADGAARSATGARDLATGLDEAASGIPNYTEAERTRLAETAVAPVEARGASDELFAASGVPLFAGIALWAGALAMFLLLAPLWRRTRDAARGIGAITLRSAAPAVLLGAVQGAVAGVLLPIALGYALDRGVPFFGTALLAGIAFALVVQGLSALLGGVGRFVAFALLVVAFAAGIVSTAPPLLVAVGDASPIGSALGGFQAIATGGSAGGAMLLLLLWGLGGLALTAFAVARARRSRAGAGAV